MEKKLAAADNAFKAVPEDAERKNAQKKYDIYIKHHAGEGSEKYQTE